MDGIVSSVLYIHIYIYVYIYIICIYIYICAAGWLNILQRLKTPLNCKESLQLAEGLCGLMFQFRGHTLRVQLSWRQTARKLGKACGAIPGFWTLMKLISHFFKKRGPAMTPFTWLIFICYDWSKPTQQDGPTNGVSECSGSQGLQAFRRILTGPLDVLVLTHGQNSSEVDVFVDACLAAFTWNGGDINSFHPNFQADCFFPLNFLLEQVGPDTGSQTLWHSASALSPADPSGFGSGYLQDDDRPIEELLCPGHPEPGWSPVDAWERCH